MWLTIKPEELDLETRQLDTLFWSIILGKSSNIRKVLPRRADKVIGGDIFNALYQWGPRLKQDPPDLALSAWLSNTMQQSSFTKLRTKTVGDRNLAAAATIRLYRELMRPQNSTIKAVATMKESLAHIEVITDTTQATPMLDAVKEAQEKLGEAIKDSVVTNANKHFMATNPMMNPPDTQDSIKALENTIADLDMAKGIADFNGSSKSANLDPNATSERVLDCLTDESIISRVTNSDHLRKILQVAGRMSIILQQAKSKKPKLAPPPVSLEYGSDLSNVLSSELANLSDSELEDIFWMKFLEGGLLQYDHKGVVNEGLGPFICCVDYSGSMSGQPLEYAKGLFVALARMAVAKRRKVVFIPFATKAGSPEFITSGLELVHTLGRTTYDSLGSGTLFMPPLTAALLVIQQEQVYKQADVLFITDGYSNVDSKWQELFIQDKERLGFRLIGINVMGRWDKKQLPMFNATANMGSQGEITKLEWLSNIADRMV